MPEKKDQETHRHAWPPEAVTCYMPTYFVLREQESGRDTYTLIRVAGGRPGFVIRTQRYADLLETVIQDATIPVFSVTPRQLIEGSFGEPRWKYDDGDGEYKYDFANRPDYFLKPDFEEREEYEPKAEGPREEDAAPGAQTAGAPTHGTVFDDYCQVHERGKRKDGHAPPKGGAHRARSTSAPTAKPASRPSRRHRLRGSRTQIEPRRHALTTTKANCLNVTSTTA
jgi:hypothetical protein